MTPELPPDLWESQEGDVPAVNPADLRSVWKLFHDTEARNPGQCTAISNSVYQNVCSPGADAVAAWYRAGMLWMLKMFPESPLAPWTHDGQFDDVVFEVAATFPMKKMATGVVYDGPGGVIGPPCQKFATASQAIGIVPYSPGLGHLRASVAAIAGTKLTGLTP